MLCAKNQLNLITLSKTNQGGDVLHPPPSLDRLTHIKPLDRDRVKKETLPQVFSWHATLSKKRLWHSCFPVNVVKFLRTPFFIELLWWQLLYNETFCKNCLQLKTKNVSTIKLLP